MMDYLKDLLSSAKSKRVLAATLTAFFVAVSSEIGVDKNQALAVAAIFCSLILGDSLRPVSRAAITTDASSNGVETR
jgi:hypothetical protein